MADLTVFAEALISTAARAFYDDEVVCLIDVLIRDKFLRDDDMAPRLQLPVKKLRSTLQFLANEHIVREENVDDLHEGGSQATRFFYIDYNRAVHAIRLRLHLLRQKLEKAEMQARSSSFYLCPGYKEKRCNGRYTEQEAQRVLDMNTGLFLCQECSRTFENDPNAPSIETYTLRLVDNEKDLKLAMDNLRRLNVQLSGKSIGNQQLRPGIYDLLQKVRGKGKAPITSNLPSENFALGIGSTRLAGTGRTAGIKAMKMQKQGLAESSAEARKYLVGGNRGGKSGANGDDASFMFLKSAHGHEIQFTVEKGGGARAQVLATARRHRRRKLMDTAASRVGVSLPIPIQVEESLKRKAEEARKKQEEQDEMDAENQQNPHKKKAKRAAHIAPTIPEFLRDNIGRGDPTVHAISQEDFDDDSDAEHNGDHFAHHSHGRHGDPELVLDDEIEEMRQTPEENRLAAFQLQYKQEMERQVKILMVTDDSTANHALFNAGGGMSPRSPMEEEDVPWEDGF